MTTEEPVPLLIGMTWSTIGGLNRYLRDLLVALRQAGVPARAVVFGSDDERDGTVDAGNEETALPLRLWRQAGAVRRAAGGIDVVDVHFALYGLWPCLVGRVRNLPQVTHFHGPWADESAVAKGGTKRLRWLVERAVYGRSDRVITLSMAFKRLVVERYALKPWDITVIPPGVDLDRFIPGRSGARAELGMDEDLTLVFCARRLIPRMGLDVLVDAWALLTEDAGGSVRQLVIAGSGPEREHLESLAAARGLGREIRFAGAISDAEMVRYLQAADLSIVPSRSLEGFGLVVLEALACGCPVIVSDVGGLPEAVAGLDPSLIVEAGRPDLLAERMEAALTGGEVPGPAACRAFATRFTWSAAALAHLEIYRRAAHPDTGPRPIRVVFLDHCARLSGAEIALSRLVPGLPGVEAHVILGETGPLLDRLGRLGVSAEVMPMAERARDLRRGSLSTPFLPLATGLATVAYVLRLAWRLRRLHPDIVHTNSLKAALYGSAAARLAGVPVVWHARDRVADDYLPRPAVCLVRTAARWLPAAIIANSSATLATLPGTGQHPRTGQHRRTGTRCATVVPDAYRPDRMVDPPVSDRHPLRIGILGRLTSWKGQHVAIQAFADADLGRDAHLVIAGDAIFGEDSYISELRGQVVRLGIEDRVDFLGHVDDVERLLAGLDILVHASIIPEPFGQVIVEGMAAGIAVVATAEGGPSEIITDGLDGVLVPPGDIPALVSALRALAFDPALRRRLGAAGRARSDRFAPERIGREVVEVYRSVLEPMVAPGQRRMTTASVR